MARADFQRELDEIIAEVAPDSDAADRLEENDYPY